MIWDIQPPTDFSDMGPQIKITCKIFQYLNNIGSKFHEQSCKIAQGPCHDISCKLTKQFWVNVSHDL